MYSNNISVDVIIRARDCNQTLPLVIEALNNQKDVFLNIYIVDNSSTPIPKSILPQDAVVIPYTLPRFNYAMAINMAIPYLISDFVLICSSHTLIRNQQAIQYALEILNSNTDLAAASFSSHHLGDFSFSSTDISNFDGWNGTWNTASLYRVSLLRERPFNPDVFSAEDQEWSRWVFTDRGLRIAHIKGAGADNINPRKSSVTKKINEWVCVAFYSYPKYLTFWFIANRIGKSIKCLLKGEVRQFVFWVIIVLALLRTRFFSPKGNSSYF